VFDTTKEDLKDILRKIDEGRLQLPSFNVIMCGETRMLPAL